MTKGWRTTAVGLAALIVGASLSGGASAQTTVPVVGMYTALSEQAQANNRTAFLSGMAELGYVEGQNIRYEFRYGGGDPAQYGPKALELAALSPSVIVSSLSACGTPAVASAFAAFRVVVASIPSASTCIANPAAPEANLTGILAPNITNATRLELAKELIPTAMRVGFLLDTSPADGGAANRTAVEAAAAALGLTVVFGTSAGLDDAVAAYQSLVDQDVDVVVFPVTGGQFNSRRAEIIALAASTGTPTVYDRRDAVAEGGLIGIGGDQTVIWHRAAYFVDQMLKGAAPAALPVEQVDAIVLAINPATAAALGITIPQSILDRADAVN